MTLPASPVYQGEEFQIHVYAETSTYINAWQVLIYYDARALEPVGNVDQSDNSLTPVSTTSHSGRAGISQQW